MEKKMSSFNDFFKAVKKTDNSLTTSKEVVATTISNTLVSVSGLFSNSEREKFATKVSEFVLSDAFLNEFSGDVGLPKENESEDKFVERAKSTMRTLLMKKLSK
jgi:hypothetical protein